MAAKTTGTILILLAAGRAPSAEPGDVNGDGRVSFADALRYGRWFFDQAEDLRPVPGSAEFAGLLDCSNMTFVTEYRGTQMHDLLYLEALRRVSPAPLPHSLERWPEPAPPQAPGPEESDRVIIQIEPAAHRGGGKDLELRAVLDTSVELAGLNLVLGAAGLDLRPPSEVQRQGLVLPSTEFYLFSGGRLVYRSAPYRALELPAGIHVLTLRAELPRGTSRGVFAIEALEGTEAVTASGEVLRPQVEAGRLEVVDPVQEGPALPFPPLRFADLEARRVAGKTELRITSARGSIGEEITARIQIRTDIPLDHVPLWLRWDGRALSLLEATPLFGDPDEGRVRPEDHDLVFFNARSPNDRRGTLQYRYHLSPRDCRPYHDPPVYGQGQPSLKYLAPLGEWLDLLELRFRIREGAAGTPRSPLELSPLPGQPAVPVFRLFPDGMGLWGGEHRCDELAGWWEYTTEYASSEVQVLDAGDPREPDPPLTPEAAAIRFTLGDAQGRPGDRVRIAVQVESAARLHTLRHVLRYDTARLELEGFEVRINRNGEEDTSFLAAGGSAFVNGPACDGLDAQGIPFGCRGGRPQFGILHGTGQGDEVPEGVIIAGVQKLAGFKGNVPEIRYWEAGVPHPIGELVFRIRADAPPGLTEVAGAEVEWRDHQLAVRTRSSTGGAPYLEGVDLTQVVRSDVPALEVFPGRVAIAGAAFVRGDADGDGAVLINDPIRILETLFLGATALDCEDAADATDDGTVDITDPIFVLSSLFLGGPPLAAPYPAAGLDPTPDGLGCSRIP